MIPRVIIDDFSAGMLSDCTIQARNGFHFGAGVDIFQEPGILQVSPQLTAMSQAASPNNITDKPIRILSYNGTYYALGSSARIYKLTSAWTKQHADTISTGYELIEFNGNLYWTTSSAIGKFNGTTYTDSASFKTGLTSTVPHPMVVMGSYLYIGNGNYVATLNTSETLSLTALVLPAGYTIYSLAPYNNQLIIGAKKGLESAIFSWDGFATTFEQVWDIKETPYAMLNWKNLLLIFAGTVGNIYAFNGAVVERIKSLRHLVPFASGGYICSQGAVTDINGNLLIGIGGSNVSACGIYQLGLDGLPLVMSHIPSAGTTNVQIDSILYTGNDQFLVGSYLYNGSTAGIDQINTTSRISSGAYWESQVYELTTSSNPVPIRAIELIARPLASGTSVTVKYKINNASSWTTAGTITSANQNVPLLGLRGLAKTVQIRLEFTCSGLYTPQIQTIKIY